MRYSQQSSSHFSTLDAGSYLNNMLVQSSIPVLLWQLAVPYLRGDITPVLLWKLTVPMLARASIPVLLLRQYASVREPAYQCCWDKRRYTSMA